MDLNALDHYLQAIYATGRSVIWPPVLRQLAMWASAQALLLQVDTPMRSRPRVFSWGEGVSGLDMGPLDLGQASAVVELGGVPDGATDGVLIHDLPEAQLVLSGLSSEAERIPAWRVTMQRLPSADPLEIDVLIRLGQLFDHIARAVRLQDLRAWQRLAATLALHERGAYSAALLIDASRRVHFHAPGLARALGAVPWVRFDGEALHMKHRKASAMAEAIAQASGTGDGRCVDAQFIIERSNGGWILTVGRQPVDIMIHDLPVPQPLAFVVIRPWPSTPTEAAEAALRVVYRLTDAEIAVAMALASGQSPEAVAATRGRRLTTVRSQVRAILGKLEVASIPALVSKVHLLKH